MASSTPTTVRSSLQTAEDLQVAPPNILQRSSNVLIHFVYDLDTKITQVKEISEQNKADILRIKRDVFVLKEDMSQLKTNVASMMADNLYMKAVLGRLDPGPQAAGDPSPDQA